MLRELSQPEVKDLLGRGKIGRLAIYDARRERVYVVPISYVYKDGVAYLHSAPGLKLDLLRQRPAHVCFQVDDVVDEDQWQSVTAWGEFEEIADARERQRALRSFGDRLLRGPLRERQLAGRAGMLGSGETVFRIHLEEMTGRSAGLAPEGGDVR